MSHTLNFVFGSCVKLKIVKLLKSQWTEVVSSILIDLSKTDSRKRKKNVGRELGSTQRLLIGCRQIWMKACGNCKDGRSLSSERIKMIGEVTGRSSFYILIKNYEVKYKNKESIEESFTIRKTFFFFMPTLKAHLRTSSIWLHSDADHLAAH